MTGEGTTVIGGRNLRKRNQQNDMGAGDGPSAVAEVVPTAPDDHIIDVASDEDVQGEGEGAPEPEEGGSKKKQEGGAEPSEERENAGSSSGGRLSQLWNMVGRLAPWSGGRRSSDGSGEASESRGGEGQLFRAYAMLLAG